MSNSDEEHNAPLGLQNTCNSSLACNGVDAEIALNEPEEEGTVHVNHIEEMPVSDSDLLFLIPV